MNEENNIIVEDDVTFDSQVDIDDVRKYIENSEKETSSEVKNTTFSQLEQKPTNTEETEQPKKLDNNFTEITLGQDVTFDTNREQGQYFDLHVNIQDDQHIITRKEKEDYLLACLNDEQFTMTLELLRGFTVTCRDLNVYENQVVQRVLFNYVKTHPNTIMSVLTNVLRQCRLPMQIVEVQGVPYNTIRLTYDPNSSTEDQLNADAEYLYKRSMELEMNTAYAKYQLYMKALNVFENKLRRLEEASFNANFWNPAGQDS